MTKRFFVLIVAAILAMPIWAQEVNTQGRDFWVSFFPNWNHEVPELSLLVTGQIPCSGKATNPRTGWSTSFTVTPGIVTTVIIPNSEGLVEKENQVELKAIHVTTTEDVSLYASNYRNWSYDVTNVFPTAILTNHYIAQSFDAGALAKHAVQDLNARMLIVAIENNTEIVIDPKGGVRGSLTPFAKKYVTLNEGECYLCISATGDISGTTVTAKNGKKIAVFSGGDTQIPFDGEYYDAVFEQCMPPAYWGRHFVVTATARRRYDMVRITALAPGCSVSIDRRQRKVLGAGKSFDYKFDSKKKEAIYISASSPVMVCVYMTSGSINDDLGDPSMVYINPLEQQMDKVTFGTFNTASTKFHFVNVVAPTSYVSKVTLDGVSIEEEFKEVPQKKDWSYARVSVSHGSHTLESSQGGFVAHIYGLGSWESYAYSVGSTTRLLNQIDSEGNLILSHIPDDPEEVDSSDSIEDVPKSPPVDIPTRTLPEIEFESLSLNQLKDGGSSRGVIEDTDRTKKDPKKYDIEAKPGFGYLFEKVDVDCSDDTIQLTFHTRGKWCDCFVPERVPVDIIMTPKNTEEGESQERIVAPIVVPITKERSWLDRCIWAVAAWVALVVLLFYLLALMRKRRFKKNAMLSPSVYGKYGEERKGNGQMLRKKTFVARFARWFLPFTERSTLVFSNPRVRVTVFATESKEVVEIPKRYIDKSTMEVDGYDFQNDPTPEQPVRLLANDQVFVRKANRFREGYLFFTPGDEDDGAFYRMLLGLLVAVDVLAALAMLVFAIRALW